MEIKGSNILFTPSEAHWAQQATNLRRMPELAQRIQDARMAHAHPWIAEAARPCTVFEARSSAEQRVSHLLALHHLLEVGRQHATDEAGNEQPVVSFAASTTDKRRLFLLAQDDYEAACDEVDLPEINQLEDQAIIDTLAATAATSDILPAEETMALINLMRDPEQIAWNVARKHDDATQQIALLGPMISTLTIDLVF